MVSFLCRRLLVKVVNKISPKMKPLNWCINFFVIFIHLQSAQCQENPKTKTIDYATLNLKTDLLRGSRWQIEQSKQGNLIEVYHAIEVVDVVRVDVETMSIRVEMQFRQRWSADDLVLPEGLFMLSDPPETNIRTTVDILDSLWSPDSYIPISRQSKISDVTAPAATVNIFKNKTIVYTARMFTILGCSFSFQWFPLDTQTCELNVESYTVSDQIVRYLWEDQQQDVTVNDIKLLQYDMKLPLTRANGSAARWGRSEKYPYVTLKFTFERQLSHSIIQIYIPTVLIVVLSYFSFWLGLDAVPGRISLLITCMLSIVTMHSTQKDGLPAVNYIKMMDIWMVACMVIIFSALCEFVLVKYLHWRKQQKDKADEDMKKQMNKYRERIRESDPIRNDYAMDNDTPNGFNNSSYPDLHNRKKSQPIQMIHSSPLWLPPDLVKQNPNGDFINYIEPNMHFGQMNPWVGPPVLEKKATPRPIWVKIDRLFRVLFPAIFLTFNAVYWPMLIVGAKNNAAEKR